MTSYPSTVKSSSTKSPPSPFQGETGEPGSSSITPEESEAPKNKLWTGRLTGAVDPVTDQLNRSIRFDRRLYPYDIQGSIAHAEMLAHQGILTADEGKAIVAGLQAIRHDLDSGALAVDETAEDIHTMIELELTRRIGEAGKKLHTARSRNDQVTTDLRLYLNQKTAEILNRIQGLRETLQVQAECYQDAVMPGYTHLQRAQPVTFGMHLSAYAAMLARDAGRFDDCRDRMMVNPLGAGALAGTSFPIDRNHTAAALGFHSVMWNTLDAVSDRDYALEFLSAASLLMMHLSRLCEEIILWCSQEFAFVTLDDAYTTGSSMMPQKKNPDVAELVRGKTGRVYGHLMALLTVMKALPLAYNKDMQEDKQAIFDAVDTVTLCLDAITPMIRTMTPQLQRMSQAVEESYTNATELANYLARKGLPFREAYAIAGQAVQHGLDHGLKLNDIPLPVYQDMCALIQADVYDAIDLKFPGSPR